MVMVTGGPRGGTRCAGLPRARDVDASWGVLPDGVWRFRGHFPPGGLSLVSVPANDRVTIVLLLPSGVPSSASRDRGIGLPETERASPVPFCDESERIAPFGASSLADRIPSKMPRV